MNEYIEVGQPLQFTDPNTPTRAGEIVENVSDIYNIPSPRLGMQVFVKSEKKSFVITSLKSKVIGGVDVPEAAVEAFEPVGAKSITWNNDNNPSNMNDFVVAGVYDIKGEHTRVDDNLPILNTGGGHSFNARLTVLDSSISGSGEDDDKCITQVLSFSNRLGQGEVYIRTGKGSSLNNLSWEKWSTLQRNVNVGEVTSLDNLVDNGIYSGVWEQGRINPISLAFVCIVINDYFIGTAPRRISQFVYGLSKFDGSVVYQSRVWDDSKDKWSDWEILNQKEISSMIKSSVDNAIKGVIADAPEAFDTLREIADWIANDETGAVALANAISANTKAINTEITRAKQAEHTINLKLNEEIERSVYADQDLLREIDNEVRRATEAEAAIVEDTDKKIAKEQARAETVEQALANDIANAPNLALRALFVAAGAEFNDSGVDKTKTAPWGETVTHKAGHYYLNGLGDLTEEQMIEIYNAGIYKGGANYYSCYNNIRTCLPAKISGQEGYGAFQIRGMFAQCINVEVARFSNETSLTGQFGISLASNIINYAFVNCQNLKYIQDISLEGSNATAISAFSNCYKLEYIKIRNLAINISFRSSSIIKKESVIFIIQKAKPASSITITLHPDAYARLANDADIVAALAAQPLVTLVSA